MRTIFFLAVTLLLAAPQSSFGGGIGGGGVPPVMQPEITSIRDSSLSAVYFEPGNTTELHTERDIESFQHMVALDLARIAGSIIPGTLPLTEDDMAFKIQPQIESVPTHLFDARSATDHLQLD